jgi:hypothetical protein
MVAADQTTQSPKKNYSLYQKLFILTTTPSIKNYSFLPFSDT